MDLQFSILPDRLKFLIVTIYSDAQFSCNHLLKALGAGFFVLLTSPSISECFLAFWNKMF